MIGWHLAATEKLGWGPGQMISKDGRAHEEPDQAIWYQYDGRQMGLITASVDGGTHKVWVERHIFDPDPLVFTGVGEPDWDFIGICAKDTWS